MIRLAPRPFPPNLQHRRARRSRPLAAAAIGVAIAAGGAMVVGSPSGATAPTEPAASSGADATGFASGADAVDAYLAALVAGDVDGAIATFAIDEYVTNFDFEAMLQRVQSYQPYQDILLPPGDPLNDALNREGRRAVVAGMIINQYFALANPELDRTMTQALTEDGAVGEFVGSMTAAMTSESLAGLAEHELVDLADVDAEAAELAASEQAVANSATMLAIVGGDESAELAVRTTLESRPVTLLFRTVRYGDQWWIETLGGHFSQLLGVELADAGVVRDDLADSGNSAVPATTG